MTSTESTYGVNGWIFQPFPAQKPNRCEWKRKEITVKKIQTQFINYEKYIKSKEWQDVRKRYFASKMPQKCMACGAKKQSGFHIHHATYKRLGMEYLSDLRLLCSQCHQDVHKLQKTTGMRLLSATNHTIRHNRKKHRLHSNPYRHN